MELKEGATYGGLAVVIVLMIFNQVQISAISSRMYMPTRHISPNADLSGVDISSITSTPMAVAMLFPELKKASNEQEIMAIIVPTGTPEYSGELGGISFDDPVTSMEYLARWYPSLKAEAQQDAGLWQRYLSLAAAPRGISCEYCCGIGPQAVDSNGEIMCGCQHAPALQAIAMGLMKYTDYSDAEVLKEVMKWKAMFFPKNMVEVAVEVAGKDVSQIKSLPGMVGGC